MTFADTLPLIWPLTFLLVVFMFLRAIGPDARLLARWIGKTLGEHAGKHAMFYAIVVGFGLQAFGTNFYDNFWPLDPINMKALGWWQVIAAFVKSCSGAIGIMVGYCLKDRNSETKPDVSILSTTETKTETTTTPKVTP